MKPVEDYRAFLKAIRSEVVGKIESDQKKGLPCPPTQKSYPEDAKLIDLVAPQDLTVGTMPLLETINQRRSRRKFTHESLTLEELSFLLWTTQGVQEAQNKDTRIRTRRTVPSAAAGHTFETYLAIRRVEGIVGGFYRYLALDHTLYLLYEDADVVHKVAKACREQMWIQDSAVVFIWTTIPYRMEWRHPLSHKVIAIDAGHVCQNLYLASESIGAGTCGIGAYYQEKVDELIGVDGKDEFTIYIAPVGKIKEAT